MLIKKGIVLHYDRLEAGRDVRCWDARISDIAPRVAPEAGEQMMGATDCYVLSGLSLVTHLCDTFDVPVQTDAGVYPAGLTEYIQVEDRLTVEIIPDGVHIHLYLVEKTFRCKGIDRVAFITDGVKGAGNPPGIFDDGLYEGVQVEVAADRGVRRTSDDTLSGSALTYIQ